MNGKTSLRELHSLDVQWTQKWMRKMRRLSYSYVYGRLTEARLLQEQVYASLLVQATEQNGGLIPLSSFRIFGYHLSVLLWIDCCSGVVDQFVE